MKILVLNCGSSSLKFQFFDMIDDYRKRIARGIVERIGMDGSFIKCSVKDNKERRIEKRLINHTEAVRFVFDLLCDKQCKIISSLEEIDAVGHRVVHGGEEFFESVFIDDEVLEAIDKYTELAPLHNPANKAGIDACRELIPNIPQIAVFDTAFHQSMKPSYYLYAVPYEYYSKYGVRKYGFHGTSHKYVFYETARFLKKDLADLRAIICHLGNGASITAVDGGRVVDTSMGFTPLDGLVMGTRSGELDPSIVSYIAERENISLSELNDILNKKSGLLGISGVSSDMRDVLSAIEKGDKRSKVALDIYVYRIVKFIGAYIAALGGVDTIVFTAGVGEKSDQVRKMVVDHFNWLGVDFDNEINKKVKYKICKISKDSSKVDILVVPTDEEYMIARDTYDKIK